MGISSFLFNGSAGSGPGPHRHPYDEIRVIGEGNLVQVDVHVSPRFIQENLT